MSWKRWHWLNDVVLPLNLITLRVCWLWLWFSLLQRGLLPAYQDGALLPAWLIGGLLLGSTVATRWVSRFSVARARLVIAVLGLAVLFLVLWRQVYRFDYALWEGQWLRLWGEEMIFWVGTVPAAYILLPAVVYLWLRGIVDGSQPVERSHVVGAFASSCLALVLFLFAADITRWGQPAGTANAIFLFFAMAMMALALSSLRIARVHETRQGEPLRLNRYWLGSVLTVILGLLLVALLLSLLISPTIVAQLLDWTWTVLSQMLIWLVQGTILILSPILFLLSRVWIRVFQRPLRLDLTSLPVLSPGTAEQNDPVSTLATLPNEWRWVGLLLFILGIGLIFALVWRRLSARRKDEIEETRELIFSSELLLAQLAQLWPDWLQRLRRVPPTLFSPFLSLVGEPDARRTIREVYQSLLAATRGSRLARDRSQTPLEYQDKLAQALPGESNAVRIITERYLQARYDAELPTAEAAEVTQQAWQRLKKSLQDRHKDQ